MDLNEVGRILEKLISIPSPYPFEKPIVEWIEKFLVDHGFDIKRIPVEERYEIVASKGVGENTLLFFGHLDTVPVQGVEDLNPHNQSDYDLIVEQAKKIGWISNPYLPRREKDQLYGSGAIDMKAGIAAILASVTALPSSWFEQNRLKIAFTVAEEHLSQGAYALLQTDFLRDVTSCISTEILDTTSRQEGSYLPGVETLLLGRRGRVAIEVTIIGRAAHAATPHKGINAIEEAARVIQHIKKAIKNSDLPLREHTILPTASLTPLSIHAGTTSLSIPSSCILVFDRHLVPPESIDLVLNEFRNCLDDINPKIEFNIRPAIRPVPYLLPFVTDTDERIVQIAKDAIKEVVGQEPIITGGNSVADENMLASKEYQPPLRHGIPTIILGCKGDNYHKENEWVDLKSLIQLAKLLIAICEGWDRNSE